MSLNAKGDKPEPPVEKRFADLERQMKKTRGANRRRAFAALRLPPEGRVPLLALVLDDATAPPADRAAAGEALADLARVDADEALLARVHAAPAAAIDVCRRIDVEEARVVLAPLLPAPVA